MAGNFLNSENYINLQIRKWKNDLNRHVAKVYTDCNIKTCSTSLGNKEM